MTNKKWNEYTESELKRLPKSPSGGSKFFFNGKLCPKKHMSPKYSIGSSCAQCQAVNRRKRKAKTVEKEGRKSITAFGITI